MTHPKAISVSAGTEINLLTDEEITIIGQISAASNYVFLVELNPSKLHAIYKPLKGERPLWDFPPEISKREKAAFLLSEQLGWNLVPTTVLREGPLGLGSMQTFIDINPEKNYLYFTPVDHAFHKEELEKLCALDIVMNSTDRQSSHILFDKSNKIWAIDNALSFHKDFKLRTIIWEFGGKNISAPIINALSKFIKDQPNKELAELLSKEEIEATVERASWLLESGCFPEDPGGHFGRPYPL